MKVTRWRAATVFGDFNVIFAKNIPSKMQNMILAKTSSYMCKDGVKCEHGITIFITLSFCIVHCAVWVHAYVEI